MGAQVILDPQIAIPDVFNPYHARCAHGCFKDIQRHSEVPGFCLVCVLTTPEQHRCAGLFLTLSNLSPLSKKEDCNCNLLLSFFFLPLPFADLIVGLLLCPVFS